MRQPFVPALTLMDCMTRSSIWLEGWNFVWLSADELKQLEDGPDSIFWLGRDKVLPAELASWKERFLGTIGRAAFFESTSFGSNGTWTCPKPGCRGALGDSEKACWRCGTPRSSH